MGLNLGHEEDGKGNKFLRPVIVLKKFNADLFWGIPLTSHVRTGSYYSRFDFKGRSGAVVLFQMRLLDRKRLLRRMGTMPEDKFYEMAEKLAGLLPKIETPLGERGFSEAEAKSNSSIAELGKTSNIVLESFNNGG